MSVSSVLVASAQWGRSLPGIECDWALRIPRPHSIRHPLRTDSIVEALPAPNPHPPFAGATGIALGTPEGLLPVIHGVGRERFHPERNGVRHPNSLGGIEFLQARHSSRFRETVS